MKGVFILQISFKSLDHVNIIRYFESFVDGNDLVIVLELADAGDLQKMIKHFKTQGKLIPEKTIWYLIIMAV